MDIGTATDLGGRKVQQDEVLIAPNLFSLASKKYHCFGIFDGHGSEGHIAARIVRDRIQVAILEKHALFENEALDTLVDIFKTVHDELSEDQTLDSYLSGTTAVIGVLVDQTLHVAHVGDSRLAIIGRDPEWTGTQITMDHNCENEVERKRLENFGARIEQLTIDGKSDGPLRIFKGTLPYPGITVSRSLGDTAGSRIGILCTPEVQTIKLKETDKFILLATDGLWDGMTLKEIVSCVSVCTNSKEAAQSLNKAGLAGLKESHIDDNITNILIGLQDDALLKMLNLNEPKSDIDSPIVWKVLIYDKFCSDLISPSLRLGELRAIGITLHMPLLSQRQQISDVPAIYFVQPTSENIKVIGDDLKRQLYGSVYVNFSSSLPRNLLEDLASLAVSSNAVTSISQVYDQYLNFVCSESNLFSLEMSKTYQILHDPNTPEQMIENLVNEIAASLFSVVVTIGRVPIIKCPKGNVAEAVAKKLDYKVRENLSNGVTNFFVDKLHLARPVLVLVDRNMDLGTMISHSWTYSTLFHDLLEMKLNRIDILVEERGKSVTKRYDIDVDDSFWSKNAFKPLPEVGMFIDEETKNYKEAVNMVGNGNEESDAVNGTQALSETMQQLPELRKRQKVLDMHTVIATSLLNSIVTRQLDSFISIEESLHKLVIIINVNKTTIIEIIKDPKKESQDKLRLFLLYFLSVSNIPKGDIKEIEQALMEAHCDISALKYLKHVHMYSKPTQVSQAPSQIPPGDLLGSFTSNLSKLTESLQSAGIGEGFGNLIASAKNLLPNRKTMPITQVVDAIMEGHSNSIVDDYLTFDPKSMRPVVAGKRQSYQDAIVFMIGGGNYNEYHNLMDYAIRSNLVKKTIVYGSTELLTAKEFIDQLGSLKMD